MVHLSCCEYIYLSFIFLFDFINDFLMSLVNVINCYVHFSLWWCNKKAHAIYADYTMTFLLWILMWPIKIHVKYLICLIQDTLCNAGFPNVNFSYCQGFRNHHITISMNIIANVINNNNDIDVIILYTKSVKSAIGCQRNRSKQCIIIAV